MRTDAILALDDDTIFDPKYIEWGYQAWKAHAGGRQRMVGYYARWAEEDGEYQWKPKISYSMVLTKAAFLHRDWMKAYWSDDPKITEAREYVEKVFNCGECCPLESNPFRSVVITSIRFSNAAVLVLIRPPVSPI